jgi:hypothetical protein
MTTDVLKVPGNYQLITNPGGTVTLSVGGTQTNGTVVIDGNLNVLGVQTTIESINATIQDNILILNSGESNSNPLGQVTLGTSGIMVSRGFSNATTAGAFLVYDDTYTSVIDSSFIGVWKFGTSQNNIGSIIEVSGITAPVGATHLHIFGDYNSTAVMSVKGTLNYQDRVTDPDDIPNKAYVDAVAGTANIAQKLQVGNSYVEIKDNAVSTLSQYYNLIPQVSVGLGTTTNVVFELKGATAKFANLSLSNNKLQVNSGTTATIILDPGSNGTIEAHGSLRIQQTTAIASTASYTGIYSTSTVGGGGTGLYFVNTNNADELVSRRRSIIYGIIF